MNVLKTLIDLFFYLLIVCPCFSQGLLDSIESSNKSLSNYRDAINSLEISKKLRDSNIDLAKYHNDMAVEFLRENGNDSLLAVALIEQAITFSYSLDYEKAFETNIEGLEIAQRFGDTLTMIDAYNSMGIDHYYQGTFDKALEYFETVANLARLQNEKERLANSYNNIGLVKSELGDISGEKEYYLRAQSIMLEIKDQEGVALTNLNLGAVYIMEDSLELAETYIDNAIDKYLSINNNAGYYDGISSKISILKKRGNFNRAIELANNTLGQIRGDNFTASEVHFLELLEALYFETENYEEAYAVLKTRKDMEDSLFSEEKSKIVAEMESRFNLQQREQEIEELGLENEKVNAELRAEQNQQRFYYAVILILILLAGFVFWRNRLEQKFSKTVSEKNRIISESLEQRETLLKEIHHRVKNNLQIISSLLNMQSRFIKDENALDAVKEGQNRVKSMAMIHQKLYQDQSLTGVNMADYVKNLLDSLERSYDISDEEVAVEIDIQPIILDIDSMIPLGLILNEMISNVYKYAFPENYEGRLTVKLQKIKDKLELTVSDNGVGIKDLEKDRRKSFGMTLINSLAEKLGGTVEVKSAKGTSYRIVMTKFKEA